MPKIAEEFYHRGNRPKGAGIKCNKAEGKTQQSFKAECDINTIVNNYNKTGLWSNSLRIATVQPMFADFTNVPDFVESQNKIARAKELFEALPISIKKRFNHNPQELLEFVYNKENEEEAIKLGFLNPKEEPKPTPAPAPEPQKTPPA